VEEDDLTSFEGWVLNRAIPEGGLVDRQALVEPSTGAGLRSMSDELVGRDGIRRRPVPHRSRPGPLR
jgi:hypothetical protein